MSEDGASAGPSGSGSSGGVTIKDDQKLAELLAGEGFAVYPLPWCPHLKQIPAEQPDMVNTKAACQECDDKKENWLCLHCFTTNCSRYVGEHQLNHFFITSHPLALSYSDLSVWCFSCDNYVDNELLYQVKNKAHQDKFSGEIMLKPDYGGAVGLEMA